MSHEELDSLIDDLEFLAEQASYGNRRWSEAWAQIKHVGQSFKGIRYPTQEDHEAAWERFQEIVAWVKGEQNRQRSEAEAKSSVHVDFILWHAHRARTCCEEHPLLDMILPSLISRKDVLKAASQEMKNAWDAFNERKHEMIGTHKKEVFGELREISDGLDRAWKACNEQYREARSSQLNARIDKHRDRLDRLYDGLGRVEQQIDKLNNKLGSARGDDFRWKVEQWLREAEDKRSGIRDSIADVEKWLEQDAERLHRLR